MPQIADDFLLGLDNMHMGFSLNQFIGITYLSNKRTFNFLAGFDFTQAFTQSKRAWNAWEESAPTQERFDALNGFKVGLILPFYIYDKGENIYY